MTSFTRIAGVDIKVQGSLLRIASIDGDQYKFLTEPEPVVAEMRRSRGRIDLFTFMQGLSSDRPQYAYPMEWDNLAVLPVSTFDHWWTRQIGFKARNKAKQAEQKGVHLREVPFDDGFVRAVREIYNENPLRQGKRFAHFGKDLEVVRRETGTFLGTSAFIGAFLADRMIGFIKLTWDDTRTQAGLMAIVSTIAHRDKAPTNALIAQAVHFCAREGIPYLVYSNFSFGKKERDGLTEFKERNGFSRVDVPRYYVPLTAIGGVALRLGLHRRLAERFPEGVASRFREIRRGWYGRKLPSISEA